MSGEKGACDTPLVVDLAHVLFPKPLSTIGRHASKGGASNVNASAPVAAPTLSNMYRTICSATARDQPLLIVLSLAVAALYR